MNLQAMSTKKLAVLQKNIGHELELRKKKLQEECEHPEYVRIMYMRPGATYVGCKVCQKAMPNLGNW